MTANYINLVSIYRCQGTTNDDNPSGDKSPKIIHGKMIMPSFTPVL